MKNLICLFAFLAMSTLGFSQVKIIANGNCGVGTDTPEQQLDVNGIAQIRGRFVTVGKLAGAQSANVRIGAARAAAGASYMDLLSGDAYTNYGTRLGRYQNGSSILGHRGTGAMQFRNFEASDMLFYTNDAVRFRIRSNGLVGVGRYPTSYRLEVQGNAGKTSGGSDWVQISDKRLKKNIREYEGGIEELMKINPVWFEYNGKAGTEEGTDYVGLIAQELQEVAPYTIQTYKHTAVTANKNDTEGEESFDETYTTEEYLAIDASAIRYMLVNAVKDQHEVIEEQAAEIDELENRLERLENQLGALLGGANLENTNNQTVVLTGDKAALQQNSPNPFHETTVINYFIPENVSFAQMEVYDLNGQLLKNVELNGTGMGTLTIKAKELAPGTYVYKLVIDGQTTDTKKMILTNN